MTAVCVRGRGAASGHEQVAAGDSASDETLIRRIAEGDQLAMRTLFARHRVALYRWLLRLVGDEALAEEPLSEVFLDVWRQAASFEGAFISLNMATRDCALQGAVGAAPSNRCRVGRGVHCA